MIYRTLFVETLFEASQAQEPFPTYPCGRMISETALRCWMVWIFTITFNFQQGVRLIFLRKIVKYFYMPNYYTF